eukprot:8743007-Pyramimonas_sp.AAC.1
MYMCLNLGVPGMLEHPCEPPEEHIVSSWRLPETRHLLSQHGVELITFDQCTCGAASRKTASLLA